MKRPLKLMMQDGEDLAIVAAHLQDAILRVGDIKYLPKERRLALLVNRFCWDDAVHRRLPPFKRVRTGLHFDGVTAVQSSNIPRENKDNVLELLTLTFEPGELPGGTIVFVFAGNAMLKLSVECVEGALADIGEPWLTPSRPQHDESENAKAEG